LGTIHGGAGVISRSSMSAENERAYRADLELALDAGYAVLDNEIVAEPCVPSSGTVKRIVAARGAATVPLLSPAWARFAAARRFWNGH
jgi:hypothetical protein